MLYQTTHSLRTMKKTAILAIAAAMPALAGTPAPVVTVPAPAPAVAPTSPCCSLELAGVYNLAARDLYSIGKSVDTYGADLTAVHSFTPNQAVTLRFGYTYGSEVYRDWEYETRWRSQVETFSVMPGYRFTTPICDTVDAFIGVNIGAARVRVDESVGYWCDNDSDWGFAYSAEVGLSKKVCDTVSVFAAYQFSGNTAKPSTDGERIQKQVYNGIRAGLQVAF